MPRSIDAFKGQGVIVGRGLDSSSGCIEHYDYDSFYTIDVDAKVNPDLVWDITHIIPGEFSKRFMLTIAEHLPLFCFPYNRLLANNNNFTLSVSGQQSFDNLWSITQDDGFILITNCPRLQENRLFLRHYNYIECTQDWLVSESEDKDYQEYRNGCVASTVVIPRNQKLTSDEVHAKMQACDLLSSYLSDYKRGHPIASLSFFDNNAFFSEAKEHVTFCFNGLSNDMDKIVHQPAPLLIKTLEEDKPLTSNKTLCIGAMLTMGIGFFAYRYFNSSQTQTFTPELRF